MEFGRASTFVETAHVPDLEMLAARFLRGVGYTGLAEVEFMYDQKHGRYELLEVNARMWAWNSVANRAGLDLPCLAYAHAIGREVSGGTAREGVKWIRLATDVPIAIREILAGKLTPRRYLASLAGDTDFATFLASDPLPFVADLLLIPYYMKHRAL
jgi:predicted ATP-grasp superfamily ATP-dependent carboligase